MDGRALAVGGTLQEAVERLREALQRRAALPPEPHEPHWTERGQAPGATLFGMRLGHVDYRCTGPNGDYDGPRTGGTWGPPGQTITATCYGSPREARAAQRGQQLLSVAVQWGERMALVAQVRVTLVKTEQDAQQCTVLMTVEGRAQFVNAEAPPAVVAGRRGINLGGV